LIKEIKESLETKLKVIDMAKKEEDLEKSSICNELMRKIKESEYAIS